MTQLFNVDGTGVLTIDAPVARSEVESAYKTALGAELNTDSGTPQGNLIDFDMSTISLMQDNLLDLANSFVPFYARGDQLDKIAAVFGYTRKQAQPTIVVCAVNGTAGTVIPVNALVSDGKNQYKTLSSITLTGSPLNVQCACTTPGSINVQPGTITEIVTTIAGWDTVTNGYVGITGYATESDDEFRKRMMENGLSIRAVGPLGAIVDRVAQLDGVFSVLARENPNDETTVIDGISMPANSVYICVAGGENEAIAKVLYQTITLGATTYGITGLKSTIEYYDPIVDYSFSYNITRAEQTNFSVKISYYPNARTPADVEDQIKTRLLDWVAENPFKIGQNVTAYNLGDAFSSFSFADIWKIEIKRTDGADPYGDAIAATIYEIFALNEANITVTELS